MLLAADSAHMNAFLLPRRGERTVAPKVRRDRAGRYLWVVCHESQVGDPGDLVELRRLALRPRLGELVGLIFVADKLLQKAQVLRVQRGEALPTFVLAVFNGL